MVTLDMLVCFIQTPLGRVAPLECVKGPSDIIRDRAAVVLASLPLCGEGEAWTQAAGRVALEAHGYVEVSPLYQ